MRHILRKGQVAERLGCSVRHLDKLIAEGVGPPIIRLGARAVGIDEDDLNAWIAARRVIPPNWQAGQAA
jgi:excisionase family DNA binding protein